MTVQLLVGDCLALLPALDAGSVQSVVTSPPYFGQRDYGIPPSDWPAITFRPVAGLPAVEVPAMRCVLGLEADPWAFVGHLVHVFREVRRVLRRDGTLWLNLGDTYAGSGRGGFVGSASTLEGSLEGQGASRAAKGSQLPAGLHEPMRAAGAVGRAWQPPPAGLKPKDLMGMPWRVALALQADGWWLRADNVWAKPNTMPESVRDRTTRAHEFVFLLAQAEHYFYDAAAIAEPATFGEPNSPQSIKSPHGQGFSRRAKRGVPPRHAAYPSSDQSNLDTVPRGQGRNARSVWTIATEPSQIAHHAMMPTALAERCVLAGSRAGDTVLDPFSGAGTTLLVADRLQRRAIGFELSPSYAASAERRIRDDIPLLATATLASSGAATCSST